jgi:hypothetical protein
MSNNSGNEGVLFLGLMLLVLGAWYFGWFEKLGASVGLRKGEAYTYRSEVGYYLEGQPTWYVGIDTTRDKCTSEAIHLYNSVNAERLNRAFSWACRKMQGEKFLERVR